MAGSSGYVYVVRMAPAAVTAAKTLVQIKVPTTLTVDILSVKVFQITKTATEFQEIQLSRWTGAFTAGTVTSATPVKLNTNDPTALCVGGTAATGTAASAEPSGGTQDILEHDVWNVLNGSWQLLDIPEGRMRIPGGGLFTAKLATAPAASQTTGCMVKFIEYV